ncbi:NAD-dependent epimerase/dehydratase family protein [Thermodesulfobacteriota bacterium]
MSESSFWSGKKVFITGVNGFIGGNLAKYLVGMGAGVTGLMRNVDEDSFLFFEEVAPHAKLIHGDLVDKELLTRIIVEEQIQCVFHLAAQVEVGVAKMYPYLTWETNIRGSYSLLEAIREHKENIEAVIIASSDKAYGEYGQDAMPYREDYPLIPVYPYDVSKACADMIARSYASTLYKLPIVVTRFCNIYGPGQLNFSALIPDSVRCALGYGEFIPRSDGTQVRDYIYVGDVTQLYALIAENLSGNQSLAGEVFNAGTSKPRSVREVVEKVFKIAGEMEKYANIEKMWADKKTVGEIDCQYMDYGKVHRIFGWQPTTAFEDGLKTTVAWFRRYLATSKTEIQ